MVYIYENDINLILRFSYNLLCNKLCITDDLFT